MGFSAFAIVELMGHNQIAGKVSEQTIAGAAMLRVDVPKTTKQEEYTKFYSAGAVYAITPVEEDVAKKAAEHFDAPPVHPWILPLSPALAAKVQVGDDDRGDDDDYLGGDAWGGRNIVHLDLGDDEADGDDLDEDEYAEEVASVVLSGAFGEDKPNYITDKRDAADWARDLLAGDFVILDTETTGLNRDRKDEPVQIAVISQTGDLLLDTLVKPSFPIPDDAIKIHGITDETVKDAPKFAEIRDKLVEVCTRGDIAIYNKTYDMAILDNADQSAGGHGFVWNFETGITTCAMEMYARFWGEWNDYHESYTWQSLAAACKQQGIPVKEAHTAFGDCQMTLALIKKMAEFETEKMPVAEKPANESAITAD